MIISRRHVTDLYNSLVLNAKDRLSRDSNDLKEKVKNNLDELIYAKEIAMKLNNLVVYYETKIKSPKEVNTKNSLAAVNEIDTIIEEIKQKFKI